jgi:hypothetical protein
MLWQRKEEIAYATEFYVAMASFKDKILHCSRVLELHQWDKQNSLAKTFFYGYVRPLGK